MTPRTMHEACSTPICTIHRVLLFALFFMLPGLVLAQGRGVEGVAIQLNQLGFLPGAAKWAAVEPGAATVAAEFTLVDAASGRSVYRGPLSAATHWAPARADVRLADFSAFTTPGHYRLQVAGLADSDAFVIADNAYAALSAASLKAFYFNRASTALLPAHAGVYARAAGHADTQVRVHASAASASRPAGTLISSPKGWYDAGDYNKYVVNSGITVHTLLAAYEHFPAFFQTQRLNIPESGGALPDVLAEVLWNLEWLLSMQDPADGGVYHKLTDLNFDGMVMPHQAHGERYVVQKSTAATLDFAAMLAMASRVYAGFESQQPGRSAHMLAAARRAWAWAQAHPAHIYQQPADVHTGTYGDAKLADEFSWAAAELFISTGEDAFYAAIQPGLADAGVPSWGDVASLGLISLAHHRDRLPAVADRRLIAQKLLGMAAGLSHRWQASAYRVAMQEPDYVWGSNSVVLNQALVLIQGYRLSGERPLLDAAQAALDNLLGRNPLAQSMVTGFGVRSPLHPHHRPSEADGVAAPVPGFLVGGPNPGQQDSKDCPVAYSSRASARSYLDHVCSYASNEIAINWNAPLVYLTAALQSLTPAPH